MLANRELPTQAFAVSARTDVLQQKSPSLACPARKIWSARIRLPMFILKHPSSCEFYYTTD